MSETMVDVLIYLFENYMAAESVAPVEQHELEDELAQAGFGQRAISQALDWLDELASRMEGQDTCQSSQGAMRIYTEDECHKLDLAGRGLLLFLEQNGILDPVSRELVIERALAVRQTTISVDEIKWITLLVLLNRPGQEQAFSLMEELIYNDDPIYLH